MTDAAGTFAGKVAVVTGGASGLGRATAVAFAEGGAKILVADVDDRGGQETVDLAGAAGGEALFATQCGGCHKVGDGTSHRIGPDLWGVVGEPIGQGANGFAFSDALKGKGGNWDFTKLNEWLTSPKAFASGTKMTFAGLSDPQDRANVIGYLNAQSDHPQALPKAPAAEAAKPAAGEAGAKQAAEAASGDAAKAKNVPVPAGTKPSEPVHAL